MIIIIVIICIVEAWPNGSRVNGFLRNTWINALGGVNQKWIVYSRVVLHPQPQPVSHTSSNNALASSTNNLTRWMQTQPTSLPQCSLTQATMNLYTMHQPRWLTRQAGRPCTGLKPHTPVLSTPLCKSWHVRGPGCLWKLPDKAQPGKWITNRLQQSYCNHCVAILQ